MKTIKTFSLNNIKDFYSNRNTDIDEDIQAVFDHLNLLFKRVYLKEEEFTYFFINNFFSSVSYRYEGRPLLVDYDHWFISDKYQLAALEMAITKNIQSLDIIYDTYKESVGYEDLLFKNWSGTTTNDTPFQEIQVKSGELMEVSNLQEANTQYRASKYNNLIKAGRTKIESQFESIITSFAEIVFSSYSLDGGVYRA